MVSLVLVVVINFPLLSSTRFSAFSFVVGSIGLDGFCDFEEGIPRGGAPRGGGPRGFPEDSFVCER